MRRGFFNRAPDLPTRSAFQHMEQDHEDRREDPDEIEPSLADDDSDTLEVSTGDIDLVISCLPGEIVPQLVAEREVRAPTLLIIGGVVSLHEKLRWFTGDANHSE